MTDMTSNKPYLIRALYEWIVDNNCTPYIVADVSQPGVQVPTEYVKDGQITLNVAQAAVKDLVMNNDEVFFSARFGGVARMVQVPNAAIVAVFARENGQGMAFEVEAQQPPAQPRGAACKCLPARTQRLGSLLLPS